jgi:hypothetical protein
MCLVMLCLSLPCLSLFHYSTVFNSYWKRLNGTRIGNGTHNGLVANLSTRLFSFILFFCFGSLGAVRLAYIHYNDTMGVFSWSWTNFLGHLFCFIILSFIYGIL